MRLMLSTSLSLIALSVPALALACGEMKSTTAKLEPKPVTTAELKALQVNHALTVLDANNADTRAKFGVIPGAVLLSSYDRYDLAKELPADRGAMLVFYCANSKCSAAPKAATRAIEAGFKYVFVLSDGIMGWREAGQPTTLASI